MSEIPADRVIGAQRLSLARDVCGNLKTVVLGTRLFPSGHPTLASYFNRLQRSLRDFLDREGPLTLEVSSGGLLVDGQLVLVPDGKTALISDPVFRDGVTEIAFAVDMPEGELAQLSDIWSISMIPDVETGQTFTTRCWEASFNGIRVVSLDNFVEYLNEEAERELNGLLQSVEAERLLGPALSPAAVPPRPGAADVHRLRMSGVREIDAADLEEGGAAMPPLDALSPAEAKAMVDEIEGERMKQSLPAITALAFAGLEASDAERAEIVAGIGAVFVSLARAAGLGAVRQTVAAFVEAARSDSDGPQRRFAALPIVLDGLGSQTLLSLCVAAISGPALDPAVEGILSYLQSGAAPALLDCMVTAPAPVAELLLPKLLALKPEADALRTRVARMQPFVAMALLDYAKSFGEADRIDVYIGAIAHAQGEVRHFAAGRVPREKLLERPESLYPLVDDDDPNLRQLAISVLLSTNDLSAVPWLLKMLDRADLPLSERRRVLRSLGGMPTREVVAALRKEFRTQPNPETAATCAMALGRVGDEFSRAALADVAGKRLVNADLKKACTEALRMLDARREQATRGVRP